MKTRTTILVIDDEPMIRELFAALLQQAGYELHVAATAKEGLKLVRQVLPALVLLDVQLPDGHGPEICRQIKSDPSLRDVFVILISGRALSVGDKVDGLEGGADEYLTKPIDGDELKARIRACLRLRDAAAALRRSEETLRVFLDALPESAALIDREGSFLLTNRELAQRLGQSREALVGKSAPSLFPIDLAQSRQAHFEEVLRTGQPAQFEDSRAGRHYLNYFNPVCDGRGTVVQVAVLALDITERKHSEEEIRTLNATLERRVQERTVELAAANEALRISRNRYRELHHSMTDAFVRFDLEGRIAESNRAYQELLGYTEAELRQFTHADLTPEKWRAAEARILEEHVLPRGASEVYQKEYVRKGGQVFPVELRTFLLREEDGQPCGMWAIVRDITERRRVEETLLTLNHELEKRVEQRTALLEIANAALKESEARYRELVMNQGEGLAIIDPDERITFINPAGAEIFGSAPHSMIWRSLDEFMPPAQFARVQAETVRRRRGKKSVYELEIFRADGQARWVLVTAVPRMDPANQLREIFCLFRDITERKEAETRLREQSERLSLALAAAQMVTWEWDLATGRIQYSDNASAIARGDDLAPYGTTEDLLQQVHPEDQDGLAAAVHQTEHGGQTFDCQYRVRMQDGRYRWIWGKGRAMPLADGRSGRMLGVSQDITEAKQAEERLLRIETALSASGVAVGMATAEGVHVYQNEAFTQLFGYTVEELGQPTGPMAVFADPAIGRSVFQTIKSGQPWHREVEMVAKNGRRFPVEERADAVKDARGRIVGLIGLHTDISERKLNERRLHMFLKLSHELSGADTVEQAATTILETGFTLFGGNRGYVLFYDAVQDRVQPVLSLDTIGGRRTRIEGAALGGAPTSLLRSVLAEGARIVDRSPGSRCPVERKQFGVNERLSASLLFAPIRTSHQCVGILSVQSYAPRAYAPQDLETLQALADLCGDALQRLRLTEELRQTEARYRSIFENATEGIFQILPDGARLLSANAALAKMLGYATPEELMGDIHDVRRLYVVPEQQDQFQRRLETEGVAHDFEAQLQCRDKRVIWVSLSAHVVRDEQGVLQYFEGTMQEITQRKQSQAALARSHRLQVSLLQNITDPAWLKDRQGRYLACNEALGNFYGLPPRSLLGKRASDVNTPEWERFRREDEVVMLSRKSAHFENRSVDAQGRTRWFETVKSPLFDEHDEITGTVGIARDITERKWAEYQLLRQRDLGVALGATSELKAAAEHLLRCALDNEGIDGAALYLVDTDTGRLTLAAQEHLSPALLKRFLQPPGAWRRKTGRRGSPRPPAFSEASVDRIARSLSRVGGLQVEAIPIRALKRVVAVLCLCCGQRNQGISTRSRHAVEAVAIQVGEAIARIRTEQALRVNRQLNERMLASLRAAVFVLDARLTTIIECNPAATRMFGYPRERLIGQSFSRLHLNQQTFGRFRAKVLAAARKREPLGDFEFRMSTAKRTTFPAEHRLSPVQDAAGQTTQWVSIIRDITARKQFEQDLRSISQRIIAAQEGERMRVARDLHDGVNQTLASVRMRLRRLEENETGLSPLNREVLARCAQLLSRALEENRRIAYNLRPAELDALGFVEACRSCCRRFQEQTHLRLTVRFAQWKLRLSAEVELNLFRILQEGLANVQKHACAKQVRVSFVGKQHAIQMVIQDDGRGFVRHGVPRSRGKHSGIGLASMRERVGSMGGRLTVESVSGRGTVIRVVVPLTPASVAAAGTAKPAALRIGRQA